MEAVALVLSLVAFGVAYLIFGLPTHKASAAGVFSFIIIAGFGALAPLLFKKDKDKVKLDERDLLIKRKSALVAYWMVWSLFPLGAMIPWFIKGPDGMITVNYLPWMVIGGTFIIATIQSIVILEEYGWRDKGNE
jgi:hypothetical protein